MESTYVVLHVDLSNRILPRWNYHCLHYLSFLSNHALGFLVQSIPFPGQIDLASVVFSKDHLLNNKLYFSKKPFF
jgi:hypothetical protein